MTVARILVLEALERGPATARELSEQTRVPLVTLRPLLSGLSGMGAIRPQARRLPDVRGHRKMTIVWEIAA